MHGLKEYCMLPPNMYNFLLPSNVNVNYSLLLQTLKLEVSDMPILRPGKLENISESQL